MRKGLRRKGLKRVRPLFSTLPLLSEVTAGLALIGGIGIIARVGCKYLRSYFKGGKGKDKGGDIEDKLEDTWVAADGVYYASYGISEMESLKGVLEGIGVSGERMADVADAVGGLTGLVSGPAEIALSAFDLKGMREAKSGKERAETFTDLLSYAGWGVGDLLDGVSTLLDLAKGISIASLEAIGSIAYVVAGLADGVLGGFEFIRGLRKKRKRLMVRGIAEMVSGFGFALSAVLPSPFSIAALVAVGMAEAINIATQLKLKRKGPELKKA